MITKEKIDRINALAHKAKTAEGLTDSEKEEQQILRREYIDSFKANLRAQLENIRFVEDEEKARGEDPSEDVIIIEED